MKLLQAMAGSRHGGAEAFFVRLAVALQRAGLEQRLLVRHEHERSAALRRAGIEFLELPFGGWLDLVTRYRFRESIASYRPQVVLTWMNRATALCPKGHFVHVARLGGYYDLKYYRGCDYLVCNTQDIVEYVVGKGWPRDRAIHLPNFAVQEKASPVPRAAFTTPEDAPLALALGRLHENKGFDVLLEALAQVPGLYLWLAGDGPLRIELERRAKDLGVASRLQLLGWRTDTAALLAAADFLVCPSRHEPLGNVVLEAWAAGVPVLATASEGPRALIAAEQTGLLVPVGDSDALAAAMRRLAADRALRLRLSESGNTAFEDQFSEAKVVPLYRDFLERVTH
ncbi:MAG TPA: glycosyltransferase [Stellaceae bacterium]|nr:glycosyltransferase [Stellaceae bacterium]